MLRLAGRIPTVKTASEVTADRTRTTVTLVCALICLLALVNVAGPRVRAASGRTELPIGDFHDILVDDERAQIFISGDTRTVDAVNQLVVTDLDGQIVDIVSAPRPSGLVLHDGVLYVGQQNHQAITKIDPATRQVIGEIALPTKMSGDIALVDGRIWYISERCGDTGRLSAVNLETEAATTWWQPGIWRCPELYSVPSHPNVLLIKDEGDYVHRVDVSTTPPTTDVEGNVKGAEVTVSPGGNTFVGPKMEEFSVTDLEATGFRYDASQFSRPIGSGAGLIAALDGDYTGSVVKIYAGGQAQPLLVFPTAPATRAVAFDAAGTRAYAVSGYDHSTNELEVFDLSKQNLDLSLEATDTVTDFGKNATFTVHLERPPDLSNTTVSFYANTEGSGIVDVMSGQVDATGTAVFEFPMDQPRTFYALFEGDDNYIGGTSNVVKVKVRMIATARLRGWVDESGGYKLYKVGDRIRVVGGSAPPYADCNYAFLLQRFVPTEDKWRYVTSVPRCRDEEGGARWVRELDDVGEYRVRSSVWSHNYLHGMSTWRYLKVVR